MWLNIKKSTLTSKQITEKIDAEFVNHCCKYRECEWIESVLTKKIWNLDKNETLIPHSRALLQNVDKETINEYLKLY